MKDWGGLGLLHCILLAKHMDVLICAFTKSQVVKLLASYNSLYSSSGTCLVSVLV